MPTIGTLFLLSFIGAGIVGTVLFLPVRLLGRRIGDLILALAALGAIGIALGTLVSLLISEYRPLFGFMESGYRLAIVLTLLFDGLTTVFLGTFLLLVVPPLIRSFRSSRMKWRRPSGRARIGIAGLPGGPGCDRNPRPDLKWERRLVGAPTRRDARCADLHL